MVVIVVCEPTIFLRMSASERHVGFTPDNWFDANLLRFPIELHGTEHVAMVGHGHGRLVKRFDLFDERLDLIRAVEETELCVEMKVDEG